MKVVYFLKSLAIWGGLERIIVGKANWLAAHGYEVAIYTSDQGRHPIPYTVDDAVKVEDLGIRLFSQYHFKG